MIATRTPAMRVPLTPDRIVDTAIAYTRRHGTAALSMRKLAAELGVEAMSLYHHVANKKTLETLMVDRALSQLPPPDPTRPWDRQLIHLLLGLYDAAVTYPVVVPALYAELSYPAGGGVLRSGGSAAAAAVARVLQVLCESPVPAMRQRAAGCGAISLVLGAVVAHQTAPDPLPTSAPSDNPGDRLSSRRRPRSRAPRTSEQEGADDLQLTLRWFVHGIAVSLRAGHTGS